MGLYGAQAVLYAYPAWSFGSKHVVNEIARPGLGPTRTTLGSVGPVFGPRGSQLPTADLYRPYGEYGCPEAPGPRPPAFSFGAKFNPHGSMDDNPGPASYNTAQSDLKALSSSWGAPPKSFLPACAPMPLYKCHPSPKAKGPSFGGPFLKLSPDPAPGPQDYYCGCAGSCCKACDSYLGITFKGRKPLLYGKVTTVTPGPAAYHTDCSTFGVATIQRTSNPLHQGVCPTYSTTAPHNVTLPPVKSNGR